MGKLQSNLSNAEEALFNLLKDITDKTDEEINKLTLKFLDQIQKKLSKKNDIELNFDGSKWKDNNNNIYSGNNFNINGLAITLNGQAKKGDSFSLISNNDLSSSLKFNLKSGNVKESLIHEQTLKTPCESDLKILKLIELPTIDVYGKVLIVDS